MEGSNRLAGKVRETVDSTFAVKWLCISPTTIFGPALGSGKILQKSTCPLSTMREIFDQFGPTLTEDLDPFKGARSQESLL
jgi:hypothetical protein